MLRKEVKIMTKPIGIRGYSPISSNKASSTTNVALKKALEDYRAKGALTQSVSNAVGDTLEISSNAAFSAVLGDQVKQIALDVETRVSHEKIQYLREQIEDGTYNVSGKDIAEAMLSRLSVLG